MSEQGQSDLPVEPPGTGAASDAPGGPTGADRDLDELSFRALIEHARDSLGVLDRDGTILYVNRASEHELGYAPEALIGRNVFDFLHPDDLDAARAAFVDRLERPSSPRPIEVRWRRPAGGWAWLEAVATPFGDTWPALRAVVSARDVTQRRTYEAELRQREAEFRSLAEHLPDGIVRFDRELRHRYVNPALAALALLAPEAMLGRTNRELDLPTGQIDEWEALLRQAFATGERVDSELTIVRRSGALVSFEVRVVPERNAEGNVEAVLAIWRETTARRQDEARLRFQELLLNTVEQAVIATDLAGHVTYWNRHAEHLYGWSAAEALGRHVVDLTVAEPGRMGSYALMPQLPGLERWSHEFEAVRRDGTTFPAYVTGTVIRDAAGETVGLVGVSTDLSERKRAEAQKLEAIGRLAGGVAHDFNNILGVILGYTDLVLPTLPAGGPAHQALLEIQAAAERGARLTQQFLTFSRRQTFAPQRVDLNAVVRGMTGMLRQAVGEDIELVIRLDPDLPPVMADPGGIEQILLNLAVNARDAMPLDAPLDRRRLTIATGRHQPVRSAPATDPEQVLHRVTRRPSPATPASGFPAPGPPTERIGAVRALPPGPDGPEYAWLEVGDTGVGMDAQSLERLFEPFFTTKPPGQGTGLGLSTVYGIVERCGGWIDITTAPGHGCTFRSYLPVAPHPAAGAGPPAAAAASTPIGDPQAQSGPQPAAADPLPSASHPPAGTRPATGAMEPAGAAIGGETILLVEDEGPLRELARTVLGQSGYTVLVAADGAEALRLSADHPGPIHLLVTDVVMPGLSGFELAEQLHQQRPSLRTLFVSGYSEAARFQPTMVDVPFPLPSQRFGSDPTAAILPKPFGAGALARRVREVLDRPG